jgi:hypothetical protein
MVRARVYGILAQEVRVDLVNGASVWYAVEGLRNNYPV